MDAARPPITTPILDLFNIGPGPSSSHTIGPMRAAAGFLAAVSGLPAETLDRAAAVDVRLLGSLAATGQGHGTPQALLAGLLGHRPESCPPDILDGLADYPGGTVVVAGRSLAISPRAVALDLLTVPRRHPNTMVFRVTAGDGTVLFTREAYSVGGGFVEWQGEELPVRALPPYPFSSMAGLRRIVEETGLALPDVLMAIEEVVSGLSRQAIVERLDGVMRVMIDVVERGLEAEGPLPGPLGLWRKAGVLFTRYRQDPQMPDRPILALCACAFAGAEENACGHIIVTAPTAGAAGVLAGVLYIVKVLRPTAGIFRKNFREALLVAGMVGLLAKHNASVSGAEVGCQGEVGVASAMAAAFLAQAHGHGVQVVENAAETALEHCLGLTCDPVAGYVQIPCIERNAMGAVKAFAAYQIAAAEAPGHHVVGLDQAIAAMAQTGRDMCTKYKETALGGLALSVPC